MRAALPVCAFVLPCLLAGCGGVNSASLYGRKVYTRDEFKKEFLGARMEEVTARLGSPDEVVRAEGVDVGGPGDVLAPPEARKGVWVYYKRTRKANSREPDGTVRLHQKGGRVHRFEW